MFDFILASQNMPFSIALVVLLTIALLEGVGSIFGAGLSNVIDSFFPVSDIDLGFDGPNTEPPTALGRILSWLRVGEVPVLVLLIVFLATFGISGLMLQKFLSTSFGFMLPAAAASIPAVAVSIPMVRVLGGILNVILPKDETSAVSTETFIGRIATIVLGDAEKGSAAQGKLKDGFGQDHYVMIEPDDDGDILKPGSKVLLVRKEGNIFFAIPNTNEFL